MEVGVFELRSDSIKECRERLTQGALRAPHRERIVDHEEDVDFVAAEGRARAVAAVDAGRLCEDTRRAGLLSLAAVRPIVTTDGDAVA